MARSHHYEVTVSWTGETSSYRSYERAHEVTAGGKAPIAGSSDPAFRGDPARWNPEELLVASLAQCHMLWFLHLCATEGVVVTGYIDNPAGTMVETADGGGQFSEVVLRPRVELADPARADQLPGLHERAHQLCFIARSVNFPVRHEPA
ncbi:OsmC family protein [Actinoplanes sp. NPDC023801]|uniref:OsmC family protein n=1 Tax=Actinoplanes sp. NPDC023801 TaxID=3154595 RepID=UPI0033C4A018